jgi:hypothetical protein
MNYIRWKFGLFWAEDNCPKCKSKMTAHGFKDHNRRYTCKCGFVAYEQ